MKKFYFLMLLSILWMGVSNAQQNYTVRTSDYESIRLTMVAPVPTVGTVSYMDVEYNVLQMPGFAESMTVGEPSLPMFGHMLEIPLCDGVTVKTENARYDTIDGATLGLTTKIMPAQRPRTKSDNSPLTLSMNRVTYESNALYSEELVTVKTIGVARNQNLAVLHFAPVQYNPVTNQVVVCRSVDVTVSYVGADQEATEAMQELHYSPAFAAAATMNTLPRKDAAYTGAPIRMLVVAGSTFSGNTNLTNYINWKKRKGYKIDVVYTSDASVGTTTTTIAAYIKSQYTNATTDNPAPTFVLLVGDATSSVSSNSTPTGALIPAFSTQLGTSGIMSGNTNEHPTDLYYFTWTDGDNLPDCYYGRFSARTATDLQNIIEKTLTYEQYTFTDPSYLNTVAMVAGVDQGSSNDNGYKFADPTHDYAITNYINGDSPYPFDYVYYWKNKYASYPTATNLQTVTTSGGSSCTQSANVRSRYNSGCGWINYSAHGDTNMWYCPELTSTQVGSMTNTGKYGVMIGNCCLTNTFTRPSCFGETLLRKANAGAVAYIGGSDYTYWYQDLYWGVGYRSTVASEGTGVGMDMSVNTSYPGAYDLMCHTSGEAQSTWHTSLGAMIAAGNNAVETSGSSGNYNYPKYYWEIYHLMGDPSVTPWLTVPDDMTINVASSITSGTTSLEVTAVPYAYVAMTTGNSEYNFVAAAFANASGVATLTLPSDLAVGTYEVTASAQQYKTGFATVSVIVPAGLYVMANSLTEDNALNVGQTATYSLALENVGTETANNVTISFASNNALVSVVNGNYNVATMNAGAAQTLNGVFSVEADASCTDQMPVTLTATISWTGCETPAVVNLNTVVNAPKPVVTYTWTPTMVAPGGSAVCAVTMKNEGHMAMENVTMTFTEDFPLVEVTGDAHTFNLAIGGTVNYSYTVNIDTQMPDAVTIPFNLNVENATYSYSEELRLLVATTTAGDDFNDNDVSDWTGGTYPWYTDNSKYNSASYSMRSYNGLSNNRTSEMSYTWTSTVDDSISFVYLTSANTNSTLVFSIDGVAQATINGTGSTQTTWTRVALPVAAGTHTYKFAFTRAQSSGWGGWGLTNAAWVDDVVFPSNATTLIAARTDQVCQDATYTLNGENVNTSTEGTQYLVEELTNGEGNLLELNVVGTIESAPITAEACGNYTWNGNSYTSSGTYTYSSTSVAGCDSVATLNLTIKDNYTITYLANGGTGTMAAQEVCSGETANLTTNSFSNGTSNFLGWATTADGEVVYADGAEVTVTANMTLYAVWSISCTDVTENISETACDSYTWYGTTYTTSGTYNKTLAGVVAGGCDSILTLNLTIATAPTINITGNVAITAGQSTTLTANGATSYEWNNGSNTASITVSPATTTTYTVTGRNSAGCEGTSSVTVTVSAAGTTYGDVYETACGEYTWALDHNTYTATGNYSYTIENGNHNGGDSVVTLHLTINTLPVVNISGNTTIATGSSTTLTANANGTVTYNWSNGMTTQSITVNPTVTTTYTVMVTNENGCTNTASATVTVGAASATYATVNETACDQYTWALNGQTYTNSGIYTATIENGNHNGGDSIVTLQLTINYSTNYTFDETTCDSYTWSQNGQAYTTSGTYTYTTTNASNCPANYTLNLTVKQSTTNTMTETACDSYTWDVNGETYTSSGVYTEVGTNAVGCEDRQTLNLTINYGVSTSETMTACDSYTWNVNGLTYTNSGTYTSMTPLSNGCYNTATLNLAILYSSSSEETQSACDNYNWYGTTYTTSGDYTYTSVGANGCNNTVVLHLTVGYSTNSTDIQEACDSYTWRNGNTYTASTNQPTVIATNADGCTETVTLNLTIHRSAHTVLYDDAVVGEVYTANGFYLPAYTEPGTYDSELNLFTAEGCDSIVTLHLTVIENSGIDDIEVNSMNIYPNPTTGKVTVAVENLTNASIELYDIYGRKLESQEMSDSQTAIDLTDYASGVYFIRVYQNGTLVGTSKLVRK